MAVYLGITNNGTFVSSDDYALYDSDNLALSATAATSKYKVVLNGVVYRFNIKLPAKESE